MAEIAAAGAALAGGAGSIFSYNKDAFVFDQTLRQNKIHQIQNMRLQQVGLYREDLRDLFGLTITKMDNYLVVNTLMLGFCIALFYDGALPPQNPPWLWWMWCLNLSGSTMFLLVSVWLSLHASITAQAFVVRLLTQWLRLPVPRTEDIDAASASLKDYEASGVGSSILRIPGLHRLAPKKAEVDATIARKHREILEGNDPRAEADRMYQIHFKLFQHLQTSWQGYDAYARVCMAMGTNQLLMTLAIFALGSTMIGDRQPWAAWAFVVVMATTALLHFRINLILSRMESLIMTLLIYFSPMSAGVAATFDYAGQTMIGKAVALVSFILNALWVYFVLVQAIESKGGLPAKFSTVGISSEIIGENQVHDFIQHELADLGIDTKNASEFLWGDTDRSSVEEEGKKSQTRELEEKCMTAQRKLQKLFRRYRRHQGEFSRLQQGEIIGLREEFEKIRNDLHLSLVELGRAGDARSAKIFKKKKWIKLNYLDDTTGLSVDYYLNSETGEIRWQPPLLKSMSALSRDFSSNDSLGESRPPTRSEIATELHDFHEAVRKFQNVTSTVDSVERLHSRRTSGPYEHGKSERISAKLLPASEEDDKSLRPPHNSSELPKRVVFSSTSGEFSDDDVKRNDKSESSNMKWNKQFMKYSSTPWTIYKQASSIVVFTWTVGLIWGLLDVLDVPTGTGLGLPSTPSVSPRRLSTSCDISATMTPFFIPVGMTTKYGRSDTLLVTDGISIWPDLPGSECLTELGRGQDATDLAWVEDSLMIAFGDEYVLNCTSEQWTKFPIEIVKIESVGSRVVATTPENIVYMLVRGVNGKWRKEVKVGDYEKGLQVIAGIAQLEEFTVGVMLTNGTLHRWDTARGSLLVTEVEHSEGVQRYTGIAALGEGLVVTAVMEDQTSQLFVV